MSIKQPPELLLNKEIENQTIKNEDDIVNDVFAQADMEIAVYRQAHLSTKTIKKKHKRAKKVVRRIGIAFVVCAVSIIGLLYINISRSGIIFERTKDAVIKGAIHFRQDLITADETTLTPDQNMQREIFSILDEQDIQTIVENSTDLQSISEKTFLSIDRGVLSDEKIQKIEEIKKKYQKDQ